MYTKKILSLFLFIAFIMFPVFVTAADADSSANIRLCLACHSDKTLNMKLMNKEVFSLYINGNEFMRSVHGKTGCSGCHPGITMENHPVSKKIKNRKDC